MLDMVVVPAVHLQSFFPISITILTISSVAESQILVINTEILTFSVAPESTANVNCPLIVLIVFSGVWRFPDYKYIH